MYRVLDADKMKHWAASHPNQELVQYVHDSIVCGLDDTADFPELPPRVIPNARTASEKPEVIDAEFAKEAAAQRFWPLCRVDEIDQFPGARAWPSGLAPKRTYSGPQKYRPTANLSKALPGEPSLNDCMPKHLLSVLYINPLHAAAAIAHFGPTARFCKFDLSSAYRHCGRLPSLLLRHLVHWGGVVYVDRSLSFGSSSAPFQFTALMSVVVYIVHERLCKQFGEENVIALFLLDDLAVVMATAEMADAAFDTVTAIYEELGLSLNIAKSGRACAVGEWLGLEFNIPLWCFGLGDHKWSAYRRDTLRAIEDGASTLKQLETLGGRLNYACYVYPNMRAFLHELWRLKAKLGTNYNFRHRHTGRFKEDMRQCLWFLEHGELRPIARYENTSFETDHPVEPGTDGLTTICGDAAGQDGFGFMSSSGHHAHSAWTPGHALTHLGTEVANLDEDDSSTYQETYCMTSAVATEIGLGGTAKHLVYYTDSKNTAMNWSKRRSKTRQINDLLRLLIPLLMCHGVTLEVRWQNRESRFMKVADMLSRGVDPACKQAVLNCFPKCTTTVTPISARTMTGDLPTVSTCSWPPA